MVDERIYINDGWLFTKEFNEKLLAAKIKAGDFKPALEKVRIPHTFTETPLNYFDESCYQMTGGYRRVFKTESAWKGKRIFVNFGGAAHEASVYINGELLGVHSSGYTAFKYEITEHLAASGKDNVLAVKLDSHENIDTPPFGFVIDYMTYGGIYRDVYFEVKDSVYIEDIFVKTEKNHVSADITFDGNPASGSEIRFYLDEWKKENPAAAGMQEVKKDSGRTSRRKVEKADEPETPAFFTVKTDGTAGGRNLTASFDVPDVKYWSPENPSLYVLKAVLCDGNGNPLDRKTVRFGFRDMVLNEDGFFINGEKYRIRGLDRHQSFAYTGYAMPESIQKHDADILKYELALNAVRTSHYPQSQYFIDRCDEIGLLVFTEIPGWQHIGKSTEWRSQAVMNVNEMITQYRNHPSIFLWGVRINESVDDDDLYAKTNAAAHECDPTRPTGGVRCIKKSNLLEDVYTYNDFVHSGSNEGCEPKSAVTSDMSKGYLISEYCGHMYPTKMTDDELHRTEHAIRHANVLDAVASHGNIAGAFGWCAFDYNTHEDFGSGDRICYHGVMDMFRNPKMAAWVYAAQQDEVPVLEISSTMDVGEHPACVRGRNWIFTNADSVKMYLNDKFIAEFKTSDSPYRNMHRGPVLIDDYVGNRFVEEEGMTPEVSDTVKCLLNQAALNGQDSLTLRHLLKGLWLKTKGLSFGRIRKLYDNYIGNWGGEATVYKFEAIKDGKVVKTCCKGPVKEIHLDASVSSYELEERSSWDAAAVRFQMKDQYGNVLPYFNEPVVLEASGAIELCGPSLTCFRGGVAGTYVKSCGKKGNGTLKIISGTKELELSFNVKAGPEEKKSARTTKK